jgi:CRISPR-associated protein Csx10
MRIRLTIRTKSPLVISERKPGGQFRRSFEYLPGMIVRGGLAQAFLGAEQEGSPLFAKLFLPPSPAIFTNAYPVARGSDEPRVIPATAVSCKDNPGFLESGHGAFDTLIDRACWELLRPAGLLYAPCCPYQDCDGRVDHFGGLYVTGGREYHRPEISQRLLTRAALNRRRGVAEDEFVYSPVALVEARPKKEVVGEEDPYEDNLFVGYLVADLDKSQGVEIEAWLRKISHLGGGGSRGLGAVDVQTAIVEGADETTEGGQRTQENKVREVQMRVGAFNQKLAERWQLYEKLRPQARPSWVPEKAKGHFFVVTLQAEAILKQGGGCPTMVLDAELLERMTRPMDKRSEKGTGINAQLVRSFATYDYRGGWNTAWGLPRDTEVVSKMGSAYLFYADNVDCAALARLEETGIGYHTEAGFGRVRICDEFHLILREEAK